MEKVLVFILALLLVFVGALVTSVFVMLLYNWIVPIIFTSGIIAPHITWVQAWGLNVLCGLLFTSHVNVNK